MSDTPASPATLVPAVPGPPLRVLIVDDEPLARQRLRGLVESLAEPRCTVAGEAADATAALRALGPPDGTPAPEVLLLDIRMPGPSGLALAERLKRAAPAPRVVFVSAHGEHALAAFDVAALDYLTKPVRRERLAEALQRAWQQLRGGGGAAPGASADGPFLVVSERGRVLRLPVAEVLLLKAEQKYVTLRTAHEAVLLDESLSELEQRLAALAPGGFIRIHRNALVARRAVRALERRPDDADEGWAVRVAPLDEWLAVSRRQLPAVRDALAEGSR